MRWFRRRVVNPAVGTLLRSPLHRLLSNSVVVVTVTGRRTGTAVTTPVQYSPGRGAIYVVSRRGRTWWRNLESNPEVSVQLRGKRFTGEATIVDLPAARMDGALESGSLASAARRPDAVIVRIRVGAAR